MCHRRKVDKICADEKLSRCILTLSDSFQIKFEGMKNVEVVC